MTHRNRIKRHDHHNHRQCVKPIATSSFSYYVPVTVKKYKVIKEKWNSGYSILRERAKSVLNSKERAWCNFATKIIWSKNQAHKSKRRLAASKVFFWVVYCYLFEKQLCFLKNYYFCRITTFVGTKGLYRFLQWMDYNCTWTWRE